MPSEPGYGGIISPKFQEEFETDAMRIFHGLFRNHFQRIESDLGNLLHEKDLKIEQLTAEVERLKNNLDKVSRRRYVIRTFKES